MKCVCGHDIQRHAHDEYHCFDCGCGFMVKEKQTSELLKRDWALISATEVKAVNLTYNSAIRKRTELFNKSKDVGLCIVTNEAARRLKTNKESK